MLNTSIFANSLQFVNSNYKQISSLATWINQELIERLVIDSKIERALQILDISVAQILIPHNKDAKLFDIYISTFYYCKRNKFPNSSRKDNNDIMIELLVKYGAKPNDSVLMDVCVVGNLRLVKLFIENGSIISVGMIKSAIEHHNVELATHLIDMAISMYPYILKDMDRIIHCVCKTQQSELLQQLIDKKISVSNISMEYVIDIMIRNESMNTDVIKVLIKNGAVRDNISDVHILKSAAIVDDTELILLMLDKQVNINSDILDIILKKRDYKAIDLVLQMSNLSVGCHCMLIIFAVKTGNLTMANKLNISYISEKVLILKAIKFGRLEFVKKYMTRYKDEYINKAIEYNRPEIVEYLKKFNKNRSD